MTKEQAIEQLKDLKAVYSGAVQAGEISIANMIKGGIDLIEKLQKENEELKEINNQLDIEKNEAIRRYNFETIPVQKIKAKIEEVDIAILECEYLDDDDEEYKKAVEKDKLCLLKQKRALQELLDNRK